MTTSELTEFRELLRKLVVATEHMAKALESLAQYNAPPTCNAVYNLGGGQEMVCIKRPHANGEHTWSRVSYEGVKKT